PGSSRRCRSCDAPSRTTLTESTRCNADESSFTVRPSGFSGNDPSAMDVRSMLSSWVEGPRFTTCTVTAPARTEDTEACSPKSCSVTTTRDPADELGPDEHPAPAVTNETAA